MKTGGLSALAVVLLSVFIPGCGDENSAPEGSTITIAPAAVSWTVTAPPGCSGTRWNETVFAISVKDVNGLPLNNIDLTVTLDLTPDSASSNVQRLRLFDDENGNNDGITDAFEEVISPYRVRTGFSGTRKLIIRVDLDCVYRATFNVYTGTQFQTANVEVST